MSPHWLCRPCLGRAHSSSAAMLLEFLCNPNCSWKPWPGGFLHLKAKQLLRVLLFFSTVVKILADIWLIHLKANSEAFRIFVKDDACFPATLTVWLLGSFPAHLSSHSVQYGCAGVAVGCPRVALMRPLCAASMAFSCCLSSSIAFAAKRAFDGRIGSSLNFPGSSLNLRCCYYIPVQESASDGVSAGVWSPSVSPPLISCSYGSDQTYFEEIKQFYYRDEFSHQVQEWNRQRTIAIERSLNQFLYVQMAKELKNKLLVEAKEYVLKVRWGTG